MNLIPICYFYSQVLRILNVFKWFIMYNYDKTLLLNMVSYHAHVFSFIYLVFQKDLTDHKCSNLRS